MRTSRSIAICLIGGFMALSHAGCTTAPAGPDVTRASTSLQFSSEKYSKVTIRIQDLTHRYAGPGATTAESNPAASDLSAMRQIENEFILSLGVKGYTTMVAAEKGSVMSPADVATTLAHDKTNAVLLVSIEGAKWTKGMLGTWDIATYDTVEGRLLGPEGEILWTGTDTPGGAPSNPDEAYRKLKESAHRVADKFPDRGKTVNMPN